MQNLYEHYCHLSTLNEKGKSNYIESLKHDEATYIALKNMLMDVNLDITQIFNESIELAGEQITGNLKTGDDVSKYKITKLLGKGGMGSVYLGKRQDGEYTQDVAIKVVPIALLSNESEQVFNYEAQTLASLSHPNVVSVLDAGRDERGFAYIVMQYINGQTLSKYVKNNRLTEQQKLELFIQVIDGITHAHANQILHRDIKPENILVDEQGQVHIIDFGISKFINSQKSENTKSYFNAISFSYASPEQKSGKRIEIASDIYSLGKVLSTLIGDNVTLKSITFKATQDDPRQRYQTTTEFKADIDGFLCNRPIAALNNPCYNSKLWFKRNYVRFSLVMIMTLVSLFSAGKYYDSYIYSQQQALLADSNLKLAENMLKQVDVKVVTEVERQRALVNSARSIDISLLPLEQAVRFTLSLANAYKTIGDYKQCQLYTSQLSKLTNGNVRFKIENLIARKIQIELNVLNNNNKEMQHDLIALNEDVLKLTDLSDNRLFSLIDWEVGTTTISNVELQKLFSLLTSHLEPVNRNQEVLLEHIKLIAISNISKSEQLSGVEALLELVESNISDISSKRWVSLLHDWYLMSNIQGKQSANNISDRLVKNAQLLQSLLDSDHPSVYVLAILAKQTSVINDFILPANISEIYNSIDTNVIPPSYQTNYFIIELAESIKNNELEKSYDIMSNVYDNLPNYGENALNYYLQFTVFANKFDRQDIYLDHLTTLIEHYKEKNNLGHAAYFTYSLCSNSASLDKNYSSFFEIGIDACEKSMEFYKKYQGEDSNFYILSLLSNLRHLTNSDDFHGVERFANEARRLKEYISYPTTEKKYYMTLVKAYIDLKKYDAAAKTLSEFEDSSTSDSFDKYLLKVDLLSITKRFDELNFALNSIPSIDCNSVSISDIEHFNTYQKKSNASQIVICEGKPHWTDIVNNPKLAEEIYSSVDRFVTTL
ncbi:Serine/threonine protein kinase [Shewanella benthica]|uniref:Serine/threonine protein kinase n=1 Tax=Shewanella benthica TaxID=43661 RepID=A0A330M6W1_9GAMM|nr:serine/threonine-protein kinase [Shewanella benthica]SQH77832.1 Serine/threonine protein kinase [Shewanella benthica]